MSARREVMRGRRALVLAPDGRRAVAAALDGAVVLVLTALTWWAGWGWVSGWAPPGGTGQWLEHILRQWSGGGVGIWAPLLTPGLWWAGWQGLWRAQTPGKRLMGLYVADASGEPLAGWQVVARASAGVLSGALLGWGFWIALVSVERRALHDWLSRTRLLWSGPKAARLMDAARLST